ncbi:glycosyltransferase [Streptomyces sp. JJ36]|uniref:glycosyltransferase n=1 Tax=Streptomyces sp. JJ36 TaxID=2736645 RepID=UPI001F2AF725|nr:glycosyltransferase [Streptomyces sp. JJ36]MCF6521972.1 glycosyltransferase [Streptomyces sp. JJ36]
MKIAFLLYNAYGIGGTIRSTSNLSRALGKRHTVEVASVHRTRDAPRLSFGPDVRLTSLIDWRRESDAYDGDHPHHAEPSTMFEDRAVNKGPLAPSRLTDERVAAYLEETDADVVVATRPVLNGYLARYGSPRQVRVGQEHLLLRMHPEQLRADQNAALAELDAFVTVSEADAGHYRQVLPDVDTRILSIPNCTVPLEVTPSTGDSRTIVAAGRLIPVKRYDRLLDAFAKVAAARPDWQLRLYGRGRKKAELRERIEELGLSDRARLMGDVSPVEPEWAKGAVAVVSSDFESFGMTIVEAMHCGVPVVATDCPHGPGEIITHGENGVLSPLEGGSDALADALLRLIDAPDERRRLATAGRRRAGDYAPDVVARRYEELFAALGAGKQTRHGPAAFARRLGARLRRPERAVRAAVRRTGDTAGTAPAPQPTARCVVTSDGGLSVTATVAPQAGEGPVDLLVRKRRDARKRHLRVPMARDDRGRYTAEVERSAHVLAEGRWDCYVVPGGQDAARDSRVEATAVEQAALLTLPPVVDRDGVTAWIPYTTSDGFLAVRAWRRPAHAEVEEVHLGEHEVSVTAALLAGPPLEEGARAVAVSRTDDAYDVEMALRPLGDGRFECRLPVSAAVSRHHAAQSLWDLRLLPEGGDDAVPLGRLTGDVVDRKSTDVLPAAERTHHARGPVRVRPYFAHDNSLALSARDLSGGPGEPA